MLLGSCRHLALSVLLPILLHLDAEPRALGSQGNVAQWLGAWTLESGLCPDSTSYWVGQLTSLRFSFLIWKMAQSKHSMAPHSCTLAWKIPWMEEPSRLQSMGLLRVGQDRATSLSISPSCTGEGNGNPLQYSCLENPRDRGAWWAAVYGVAQSRTRLKRFSSSKHSM